MEIVPKVVQRAKADVVPPEVKPVEQYGMMGSAAPSPKRTHPTISAYLIDDLSEN